jgi:integrase
MPNVTPLSGDLALFRGYERRGALSVWAREGVGVDCDIAEARRLIANDRAPSTVEKYARSWSLFVAWVSANVPDADAVPAHPAVVGRYIAAMRRSGQTRAWILGKLAAIAYAHELLGLAKPWTAHPELAREIKGLRRDGDRQKQERGGLEREVASGALDRLRPAKTLLELRDRAVFTLGWMSAQRRSTLAALRVGDVAFKIDPIRGQRYLEVFVARSKTDQEGRGRWIVVTELAADHGDVALCAVRALERWLEAAGIREQRELPLFRTFPADEGQRMTDRPIHPYDVARIVKRLCAQAGLDPTLYAAHSLRRGFAVSADAAGVARALIMEQGGWATSAMVDHYSRAGKARNNVIADLFSAVGHRQRETDG